MTLNKQEYRSNSYVLCQLLVFSGKSQLSNYASSHCLKKLIWTWLMSYHVKTTSCHDITTYHIIIMAALISLCMVLMCTGRLITAD